MRYPYFFCGEEDMFRDSWTYGDWRQYICNRPGGQTQCARFSRIPAYGLLIGLVCLTLVGFAAFMNWNDVPVRWSLVAMTAVVGCLAITPFVAGWFFQVYLMKAVGPMNDGARRVCPWDKTK